MGSVTFDLNEQQPHENRGGSFSCVLLQKDRKNICRTKICDLPIEVPFVWPLISFMPTKAYQKSVLPKFSLLPYPEDGRQKHEWGKFMRFLWDNKKAAIARCGSSTFHILASQPDECLNFSHAELLYESGQNGSGDCKQMEGTSGRYVESPAMNSSKRPYKSEFLYGSKNSRPAYFKEEICDSGLNPKEMETLTEHNNPHDTALPRPVAESSPCVGDLC